MKTLHFGEVSVDKVIDGIERFPALNAFPEIDIELFNQNLEFNLNVEISLCLERI